MSSRRAANAVVVALMLFALLAIEVEAVAVTIPARPAVVSGNRWFVRDTLSSGFAEGSFVYGTTSQFGVPLMGDWDGDGVKTAGVVYGNQWYLRNSNTTGFADIRLTYGFGGGFPVAGDWDGDGIDTPGMVDVIPPESQDARSSQQSVCPGTSTWYLRDSNTGGVAEQTLTYGCAGFPLAGDWDGDGDDTPLIRNRGGNSWLLTNDLDQTLESTFAYGTADDFSIVGDWDGDGDDTAGVRQWNVWALRNTNTSGVADFSFAFGQRNALSPGLGRRKYVTRPGRTPS